MNLSRAVFVILGTCGALGACSADADGPLGGESGSGATGGSGAATTGGNGGTVSGTGGTGGVVSGTGGASGGTGAGPGTGGTSGATGTAGPCTAAGLFACDDFESGALDTARWSLIGDPGKFAVIDTAQRNSGSHSIFFGNIDNRGSFVAPISGLPAANNRFYVRTYVRFATAMINMGGHVAFIEGATLPENGVEVRIGASKNFQSQVEMLDINFLGSGQEHTQFSNGDYTGGQGTNNPGVTLDANRWYCIEALFDGQASEMRVWLDDVEITQLHVTDWGVGRTNWAPTYNVGKVGGQKYSGDTGQIWYDDIAFGTARIGCY
jgi:hypothetical protein